MLGTPFKSYIVSVTLLYPAEEKYNTERRNIFQVYKILLGRYKPLILGKEYSKR